jgi:threonine/homoserine/homoserine lactone efflux protein
MTTAEFTAPEFTALLLLCTAASFTPGPNTTLSTALAANFGFRRALRFVFAVPLGWGLLFTLCVFGAGAAVVAVPALRIGIQGIGIAYLLWLAFKLSRSGQLSEADAAQFNVTFWQGVALQFLNIKAWLLALTVAAGWLAGRADLMARFAVILPLMLAFGLASNLSYAAMGSLLRQWLARGARLLWFNRAMALVLLATAVWMTRL